MYNVECLYREMDAVSVCHRRFLCQHIDVSQIFEIDVTLPSTIIRMFQSIKFTGRLFFFRGGVLPARSIRTKEMLFARWPSYRHTL